MLAKLDDRNDLNSENSAQRYIDKAPLSHRKSFGQFFTPSNVSDLMADWVAGAGAQRLLDPAFGTGILSAACLTKNPDARMSGYEKDGYILGFIPKQLAQCVLVIKEDFLRSEIIPAYDGVIMNPPYIRHREIEGYERERVKISAQSKCLIPRSANLYIYFSLKAIAAIKNGGRGAFLLPSEWMSANFSFSFKQYLLTRNLLRHIVVFSNCSAVFEGALTTASVLLIEKSYE